MRGPVGFYTDKRKVIHPVCGPCSRYVASLPKTVRKNRTRNMASIPKTPHHLRSAAHKAVIKGEAGLNARATGKISRRYPGKVTAILEAAQSAYHFHHPQSMTSAEPYELMEGGFVNEGLESMGLRPLA